MGSRRLSTLAAFSHPDTAALKRGARVTVRFAHRRVAVPTATFLLDSVEGLFNFIDEFADSVDEVRKAMARARTERYTISAHRR
jgi:L-aminopeptidase/D-esterase-like protein